MNKIITLLFLLVWGTSPVKATALPENLQNPRIITVLHGTVEMELSEGEDFPCIGIQFADKNINQGMGTYLEIKRAGKAYLMSYNYKLKKFKRIDQAITVYLKDLLQRFYQEAGKKYSNKVWKAFVREGGLQQFINYSKEVMDDEFLNSPFNETYG